MKRVCAWCKKELPPALVDGESARLITHGICDKCAENLRSSPRMTVGEFLESLNEPVFLASGEATFVAANRKAREVVGKDASEIDDHLCGEVIECANSYLPGGCGKTECCRACTIRNTVVDTFATGRNHKRIPAYTDVKTADGMQRKRFVISTEKVGDAVLLRIDEVAPCDGTDQE